MGEEHVCTDPSVLRAVERTTFRTTQRVPGVIYPGIREEVQECVRIANRYRVPVYPVSTGKNWGYGSRVPVTDGCVIMELKRLNRIVDFSEELAYIMVESGVTIQQVVDFLDVRGARVALGVGRGPPDDSLIANTLERGIAGSPTGERCASICALEVVLPTGKIVHTAFSCFENAKGRRAGSSLLNGTVRRRSIHAGESKECRRLPTHLSTKGSQRPVIRLHFL